MSIWKNLAVILCLLGYVAGPDMAQEGSEEEAIRALELKWVDAYKQRHIAVLASLLGHDYVMTVEDGTRYSKAGLISHNRGPLRVDVAEMLDLKIRGHENVAVVTGTYHERGESGGKLYDSTDRLTDVWMKVGGKWQLIASHYSLPTKI